VSHYVNRDEFIYEHEMNVASSLHIFDTMANFGSSKSIRSMREQLQQDVSSTYETYKTMNDGRNPLAGVEMYVGKAFVSYFCSSNYLNNNRLLFALACFFSRTLFLPDISFQYW
jgi:hypothetical protein